MENFAKLLTSLAAILSAIAWPAALITLAYVFKAEFKNALIQMASAINRLNKATFPGILLELDKIAEEEAANETEKGGHVTPRQVEAAARIKIKSQNVEPQAILDELDSLCLQYDSLRKTMPASRERTQAMTGIIVKMRSLAPSVVKNIDIYKNSPSPGSRLAAIAIMQMIPSTVDLNWLEKRFSSEQPFVFYHASLAMQNYYNITMENEMKLQIVATAKRALNKINSFDGKSDRNTIAILEDITRKIPTQHK